MSRIMVLTSSTMVTSSMMVLILGVLLLCLPQASRAQPPPLVSDVNIASITTTSAVASWSQTAGNFDSYKFTINPSAGVVFNPATILKASSSPKITITGLTVGTRYTLSVRTLSGATEGTAKTRVFNTKPAAVLQSSISVQSVTSQTAELNWGAVTTGLFDNYLLSLSPSKLGGATLVPTKVTRGSPTSAALQNLTPGTEYTITIKTKYGTEESAVRSLKFKTVPSDVTQSSIRVTNLTPNSATLNWDAVSVGTLDNYELSINPTTGGARVTPSSVPRGTRSASLQNLTPNTEYTVTVKTVYGVRRSAGVIFKFNPGLPNIASAIRISSVTTTSVVASWSQTLGNFNSYKFTINPPAGVVFTPTTIPKASTSPQTTITGLKVGTRYTLSVRTLSGVTEGNAKTVTFNTAPAPVALSSVQVKDVTSNSGTLTWGAVTTGLFDNYLLSISPTTGGGAIVVPTTVRRGAAPTAVLQNLTPGTEYSVNIKTKYGDQESTLTVFKFKTVPSPVKPSSLRIANLTPTSATLSWDAVTVGTLDNYLISISPRDGGVAVSPSTVPKGTLSTKLQSLTPGTEYTVTVTTKYGNRESGGAVRKFTTNPNDVEKTSIKVSKVTSTSATLTWAPVKLGQFDNYKLTLQPTDGGANIDPSTVPKGTVTTKLKSLTAGIRYTVVIKTTLAALQSPGSTFSFTTVPNAVDDKSIAFSNVEASSATVTWTAASGSFDNYVVKIRPTAGGAKADPPSVGKGIHLTSLKSLTAGTQYTVTIVTSAGGRESNPAEKAFWTKPAFVTSRFIAIKDLTSTSATLTWSPVTVGTFEHYVVTIASTAPGATADPNPIPKGVEQTALKNLVAGIEYTITIKTRNKGVESTSATFKFITLPNPPSGVTFSNIQTNSATVTWSPASGTFTGYEIRISPQDGAKADPDYVLKGTHTTSLKTLTGGTAYTVTIRAKVATTYSNPASKILKTRPVAVDLTSVRVEQVTATSAVLRWSAVAKGTVDQYLISISPTDGKAEAFPNAVNKGITRTNLVSLTPGTQYTVNLQTKFGGLTGATTVYRFFTLPPNLASAPTVTDITTSTATVSWTKTEGIFDSYRITISPNTEGEKVDTPTISKTAGNLRTTLSGLKPMRTYTVSVSTLQGSTLGAARSTSFSTKDCEPGYFREAGAAKCLECHCIGTCYEKIGCKDSACSKGYMGTPLCQQPCPNDMFGFGCKTKCHCKLGDKCSHISGTCPKGCHPDYWGADCQKVLPGIGQAPKLLNPTCQSVTVEWQAFDSDTDDSDFPISRYLVQMNINGDASWTDVPPFYPHEPNKTYTHTVTGLKDSMTYKFQVRTDANLTIEFPVLSYVPLPGRPSPESTSMTPPCPRTTTTVRPKTTTTPTPPTTTPTTTPVPGAPSVPVNVRVTSTQTSVEVMWEAPASKDQTGYDVAYGRTAIGDCHTVPSGEYTEKTDTLTAASTKTVIGDLRPWSSYKITLRATNLRGKGAPAVNTIVTKQAAPTGRCSNVITSNPTASTFELSFTPPPCETRNGALKRYRVRVTDTTAKIIRPTFYDYTSTNVTYTVPGLNPDTTYKVAVSFVNALEKETAFSDEKSITTIKWTIVHTTKPGSVELNWQLLYPRIGDVLGNYKVTYWEDKASSARKTATTAKTTFTVNNLPAAVMKFQLSIESTRGWKVQSEIASVNTSETVPSSPVSLALVTTTESGLSLKWNAPTSSPTAVTHYKVDYQYTKTGLASPSLLTNTSGSHEVPATETDFGLTPLDPATTYQISVSAKNLVGYGDSAVVMYSTQPGIPDDPKAPTVQENDQTTITLVLVLPTSTKGPITKMYVVLEKKAARRRRAVTSLCSKTPAKELVATDYKQNKATVILGNGAKGSANAPLEPGTTYTVCYRVDSTYEGGTKTAATTFDAATKAAVTNTTLIIIIVVVILLIIIIVIIIVVVVLLLRKKKRKAALRTPWPDTLKLNQFDDTVYNVKPYGRWSNVHNVGEPRHIELVKDVVDADLNIIPIEDEYHKLPHDPLYTWDHALAPENKAKNRFENFLPYDHSRVTLNRPRQDYINANYIDGWKKPRAYIAAQSPFNSDTVTDFWHMVCQENTLQIVMLCHPIEEGVLKCEQYWPDSSKSYGGIKVTLNSTDKFAYFCVRTFEVVPNPHSRKIVTHYQFTGWPIHGNPEDPIPFLDFINKVHSQAQPGAGPVVVHSGTGVSRTSVYIAVDSLIKEGIKRGEVNVYNFCSKMRQNRYGMVRTLKQYLFIYDTLYEALLVPNTVLDIDMRAGYHELISKNPSTGHTNLYEQFKIFRDYTPLVDESKCRAGRSAANKRKSRFPQILPADEFRPKLKTPGGHGRTDFINAVILDSYTRKEAFFVTQTPLTNTVVDFWKLVYDYKISTIVMLHDRKYKEESSAEYWPKTLGSVRYDPFVVTLKTFVKEREYVISRTMDVNNKIRPSEKPHEVKQFQLDGDWLMYDHVPKSRECVLQLIDAVFENRKKTADHPETPILVHCIDGASRSGLFCCLMSLVERMQVDKYADIFHGMKHLKRRRAQFVDDLEQYRFCFKALWDFINTRMVLLPATIPRKGETMNGTSRGKDKKRKDRHLELTLAAKDLNNYDYTLSVV